MTFSCRTARTSKFTTLLEKVILCRTSKSTLAEESLSDSLMQNVYNASDNREQTVLHRTSNETAKDVYLKVTNHNTSGRNSSFAKRKYWGKKVFSFKKSVPCTCKISKFQKLKCSSSPPPLLSLTYNHSEFQKVN